ncbi:hypothetical protein M2138_000801 [Dysgonomonadaceae bacterium PH5-43]|nr:hypothetical protein [Dysgonomonadaceae bacterium PH5-43]
MKKFIKNIALFITIIILSLLLLEIALINIPNVYSCKKDFLDSNSSEIETLILGNSHSYFGLNPIYFSNKTFNAANVSQDLVCDFDIYKKYSDKLNHLKTIIIPISYFSLWHNLEKSEEDWRLKNYSIYFDIKKDFSFRHNFEISNSKDIISQKLSYYTNNNHKVTCSKLGWGNTYISTNLEDSGIARASAHTKDSLFSVENKTLFEKNICILTQIINLNPNINIVFFIPPAYETYRVNIRQEQLALTIKTMTELIDKHRNCSFYNFFNESSFVETDYYDADHLNELGAKKLSLIIESKIKTEL